MDETLFKQILEILKASVPIFSLIAVIVAAYLNARYSRKQRVRDELFSYKVKAYMKIAETVYSIRNDYGKKFDLIMHEGTTYLDRNLPKDITKFHGSEFNSNILFLNVEMQDKVYKFSSKLLEATEKIQNLSDKTMLMEEHYKMTIFCDKMISDLQEEIGLNKIKN